MVFMPYKPFLPPKTLIKYHKKSGWILVWVGFLLVVPVQVYGNRNFYKLLRLWFNQSWIDQNVQYPAAYYSNRSDIPVCLGPRLTIIGQ